MRIRHRYVYDQTHYLTVQNQVGFFDFIVLPFFRVVADIGITPGFHMLLEQTLVNYQLWKAAEAQGLKAIAEIIPTMFLNHDQDA